MSGAASLDHAVINLQTLRDHGRRELIDVLDSVRGNKALILDPKFVGPLGLVAEMALLKEHGVEKIYHLSDGPLQTPCKNLIYLCRPRVAFMHMIAAHIHDHTKSGLQKEYSLFFVPRRTMICERVLEEQGVYGDIAIGQFMLDLIPYDYDILSLELEGSFREVFLDGDATSLFYVARSLMKLQSIFGVIPNVKGKGTMSARVKDMLFRMRKEMTNDEPCVTPEIDTLILIDREVDMVTPMCTQLTYEGLIDETFGINNGYVDLDPAIVQAKDKEGNAVTSDKKIKYALNSNDQFFREIRDLNFSAVAGVLNSKAKEINQYYETRHQAQTVRDLRDFMKGLTDYRQGHESLLIHINIYEAIDTITKDPDFHKRLEAEQMLVVTDDAPIDYIEESICRQEALVKVLRLLVLTAVVHNGLKARYFDFIRREILQTYGYEFSATLHALERLTMLMAQDGTGSNYKTLRRALKLVVPDVSEQNPTDIAYVYSGYAPLSVRLVQAAIYPGWRAIDDVMRLIPGPTFEEAQVLPKSVTAAAMSTARMNEQNQQQQQQQQQQKRVVLVFFIGGVTYAEIAALRFLASQEEGKTARRNVEFIIATTKLINGDSFLTSLIDLPGST
eukprot:TRINITY_DN1158_c0_g1_i1.p1 TRINITY_DN1158_c0_g1~~TRINITY_DN1158_c0_g1_i1.p1  ORF type:complete len:617 (-),score=161.35 TRINITY_DN1158_c0_g1_i1:116-1966(-)